MLHLKEPQYLYIVPQAKDGWVARVSGMCGNSAPAALEGVPASSIHAAWHRFSKKTSYFNGLRAKIAQKKRLEPESKAKQQYRQRVLGLITGSLGSRESG
tara:strand:- start:4927 stop:5226 length:300 start_codon:yes stop_codon:yes gene_type:complete